MGVTTTKKMKKTHGPSYLLHAAHICPLEMERRSCANFTGIMNHSYQESNMLVGMWSIKRSSHAPQWYGLLSPLCSAHTLSWRVHEGQDYFISKAAIFPAGEQPNGFWGHLVLLNLFVFIFICAAEQEKMNAIDHNLVCVLFIKINESTLLGW